LNVTVFLAVCASIGFADTIRACIVGAEMHVQNCVPASDIVPVTDAKSIISPFRIAFVIGSIDAVKHNMSQHRCHFIRFLSGI
uniref:Secreted protein n=1 Tax=Haemonchus placei TaxID=6290 RepID=A0A0N4X863_HAEPC